MLFFRKKDKGALAVLASAFFFYLSTFYLKLGTKVDGLSAVYFVFARFLFGYLATVLYIAFAHKNHSQQNFFSYFFVSSFRASSWLWIRALGNNIAVFFFFMAVAYGNVTNANFFNMLYPAFVAIFSPWLLSENNTFSSWLGILFSVLGAYLIVQSGEVLVLTAGDWFGIMSAIFASIAIVALRKLRKQECSTEKILLFTFQLGTLISLVAVIVHAAYNKFSFSQISPATYVYIIASASFGLLGQWAITYGFRYVTAVHGSILSATRILIALFLGWFFWRQPFHWANFAGALLIFFANILLAFKNKKK